jgi:hypothetical protein
MPLDIQSYFPALESKTITTRKFSKKFMDRIEECEKRGKVFEKIVKKGNLSALKDQLDKDITGIKTNNHYCLLFSCSNGYYQIVKMLIEYVYLKEDTLYKTFSYPIKRTIMNSHTNIMIYLLDILKVKNELEMIKPIIETMVFLNFNIDVDYSLYLKDNELNIQNSRKIVKTNIEYNKTFNRNRNANISMFDELLIDASNDFDNEIGIDHVEEEETEEINEINEGEGDDEGDEEGDEGKEDFEVEEDNEDDDLFGDESDIEEEIEEKIVEKVKKLSLISGPYKSNIFKKNYNNNSISYNVIKNKKNKRIEIILWLLSNDYNIITNYQFISQYCVNYNLTQVITILKNKNKFLFNEDIEMTS